MINKNNASGIGGDKYNYIDILSDELGNSKQFVCFNQKKEPLSPINLKLVSWTNKNNLTSINEALFSANKHNFGIGIVLGKSINGNLCGIDIDKCIDESGNISKEAKEIIDLFDSYTEISISGKGIHILFYATKKGSNCVNSNLKWCGRLEMYNKHFFTLSGNIINNKGIEPRQEQCDFIYKKYFADRNKFINCAEFATIKPLSKEKIEEYRNLIKKIIENMQDKVFIDLWQGKRPTNDESSNDMKLFIKLCHYTSCNPQLIEILALESPFYKTKKDDEKAKAENKGKYKWLNRRKGYLIPSILKAISIYQNGRIGEA